MVSSNGTFVADLTSLRASLCHAVQALRLCSGAAKQCRRNGLAPSAGGRALVRLAEGVNPQYCSLLKDKAIEFGWVTTLVGTLDASLCLHPVCQSCKIP